MSLLASYVLHDKLTPIHTVTHLDIESPKLPYRGLKSSWENIERRAKYEHILYNYLYTY